MLMRTPRELGGNLRSKTAAGLRYSCVSRFIDNATDILEAAENVMMTGQAPSELAILLGVEGGIRIVADSDWPLESLQREHGAQSAYRVSSTSDGVRVEGREGLRTCHFETTTPAQVAHLMLNAVPRCYSFAQPALASFA